MSKRLPPYGRTLLAMQQNGHPPPNDIFVFLGQLAWEKARFFATRQAVLVLPLEESPYHFHWPVKNQSVLMCITSELEPTRIKQTAHALLLAHALIVRAVWLNSTHPLIIFTR